MLGLLLRSEWMKIKRKGLWLLSLIGPLGVIGLTIVNFELRSDYLFSFDEEPWQIYLDQIIGFTGLALVLGVVILTSLMASIENQTSAWKQWLALPVRRSTVFLSKYVIVSALTLVASIVLCICTMGYGVWRLQLESPYPWEMIIQYSFYPWLASQAIIAFHLWVATVNQNQGVTVSIGVIGVFINFLGYNAPDWLIWKWPSLFNTELDISLVPIIGICGAILIGSLAALHFSRKDVV